MRLLPSLAAALAALSVRAVPSSNGVPGLGPSEAPTLAGAFQVFFALMLVLGAIFLCAWLLRRFGPGQLGGNAQMRVVSGVMVGPKERVVIVEVRDTWLVLGVTANEVSTLHVLTRPEDAVAAVNVGVRPFAERLAVAILHRRGAADAGDRTPGDGQ